jgi:hypothetical protein
MSLSLRAGLHALFPVALILMLAATATGQGEIYATNGSDYPISVYPRTGNGQVPPLRVIGGQGGVNAESIVVDEVNNEIIVGNTIGCFNSAIFVYDRQASGPAAPRRTIRGPATGLLNGCNSADALALDLVHNEIFVCCGNDPTNFGAGDGILVFSRTANGNISPLRRLLGPATGINGLPFRNIAVDPVNNELYVSDFSGTVRVFHRTASGNALPVRQFRGFIPGTNIFMGATSIALDVANDEILVGHTAGVAAFGRTASGSVAPLRGITNFAAPPGVRTVRLDPVHDEMFLYHESTGIEVYRRTDSGSAAPLRTIPTGAGTQLAGGTRTSLAVTANAPQLNVVASVNQATFVPGQTLTTTGGVTNPGIPGAADFYVGLLRPDGNVEFFTSLDTTVFGNVDDLSSFQPIATSVSLAAPFTVTAPNFYTRPWTGNEPRGAYTFFVAAVKAGALGDGVVMSDEILGIATAPFSFPLESGVNVNAVVVQPGPENGKDIWTTSVYSYAPGGGGPGGGLDNEELRVGGWGDLYYSLLQFDLTGLPPSANTAFLELYDFSANGGSAVEMHLDRVTAPWSWTDRLWWADQPPATQWSASPLPAPSVDAWYRIDITDLYNAWQAGTYRNYGVRLRPTANDNRFNLFYSSDHMGDPSLRPRLVVTP